CIVTAGMPNAVKDGIVPVGIVIGVLSVPATVVRLQRVMRPANTGISACHYNPLSRKSEPPDVWRMGILDARLDGRRTAACVGLRRRLINGLWLRKVVLDVRIAFYPRHVRATCQRLGNLAGAFHQNRVNNVEGT